MHLRRPRDLLFLVAPLKVKLSKYSDKAITIGANNASGEKTAADFAEVLVYDRALNSIEQAAVGRYLGSKYQITTAYQPVPNEILTIAARIQDERSPEHNLVVALKALRGGFVGEHFTQSLSFTKASGSRSSKTIPSCWELHFNSRATVPAERPEGTHFGTINPRRNC
jgi:hypothetical protein